MGKRALSTLVSVWIGCVLGVAVPSRGAVAETHVVNLYRGEIDGVLFSQMTLEVLISRFGQPSALEQHDSPREGHRVKVSYHDFGLAFWLQPSRANITPLCWSVTIYMIQIWDEKAGKLFLPFAGRVSKGVSHVWSPSRMETEFKAFFPRVYTQTQKETMLKDDETIFHSFTEDYRVAYIEFVEFKVDFFYNNSMKFLETIRISVNKTTKTDK